MVDNYTQNRFGTVSVICIAGIFGIAGFLLGRARELNRLEGGV